MTRGSSLLLAISLAAGFACTVSLAEPPAEAPKPVPAKAIQPAPGSTIGEAAAPAAADDDPVTAAVNSFKAKRAEIAKSGKMDRAALTKAAEESLASIKISELSAAQLKKIADSGMLPLSPQATRDEFSTRTTALAKEPTAEGARAALLNLSTAPMAKEPQQAEIAKAALTHPKLAEVISEPGSLRALAALDAINDDVLKPIVNDVIGLAKIIPDTVSPTDTFALRGIVQSIAGATTPAEREPLRLRALTVTRNTLNKMSEDDKARDSVASMERLLDGAYMKTGLVGYPAPDMDFTWASTDKPVTKLSDLKGKVVVVDFWATWCGPCRSSFPNVKKLQAYYKDSPVVILGVTSLQGSHTDPKAEKKEEQRIDCKGDAQKEYGLMPGFMKNWDMTWPVAFSTQNVFNPDYGVSGIPHVVIIDAKGVVRYRGLHPGSGLKEKTEHINDLLKEANLPVPAPFVDDAPKPAPAAAKPADGAKN